PNRLVAAAGKKQKLRNEPPDRLRRRRCSKSKNYETNWLVARRQNQERPNERRRRPPHFFEGGWRLPQDPKGGCPPLGVRDPCLKLVVIELGSRVEEGHAALDRGPDVVFGIFDLSCRFHDLIQPLLRDHDDAVSIARQDVARDDGYLPERDLCV